MFTGGKYFSEHKTNLLCLIHFKLYLRDIKQKLFKQPLSEFPDGKILISTMNAHSFCVLQKDKLFQRAIIGSHVILPDGISIVWAIKFLFGEKLKKIAGADLFAWEMDRLQKAKGTCYFLGSSDATLIKIVEIAKINYPDVSIDCYSPPFRSSFSEVENDMMVEKVNFFKPDVLFVGMTAPKQEKWAAHNFERLNANHICSIGAVFDFFAQTKKRAPQWMIKSGIEWFHRLTSEPQRNWKRYILGNSIFIGLILKEKWKIISR